ncbi:MAG: mechanosensitive ion channel family protein, partial [Pseudomonadota bacterium]|nr:mechanosensitive ion channel family protein [Pseudomonadota bacterium]
MAQLLLPTTGVLLVVLLAGFVQDVSAAGRDSALGFLVGAPEASRIEIPADLTAENADAFLAGVTDAQARELLRNELGRAAGEQAAEVSTPRVYTRMIMHLRDVGFRLRSEGRALLDSLDDAGRESRIMVRNLTDDQGWPAVLEAAGVLLFLVAIGFIVLLPVERLLKDVRGKLLRGAGQPLYRRIACQLGEMIIGLLLVFVFTLVTLGLSFLIFERFHPLRVFISTYLIVIAVVWGIHVALKGIFPVQESASPLALPPVVAGKIRRYLLIHFSIVVFSLASSGLLELLGISRELDRVLLIMVFSIAFLVLVAGIWDLRRVLRGWMQEQPENEGRESLLGDYARIWHWLSLLGMVVFYLLWLLNIVLDHRDEAFFAYLGMLLVLLFPLLVHLLNGLSGPRDEAAVGREARNGGSFAGLVRTLCVLLYSFLMLVFLADALGAGIFGWLGGDHGRMLLQSLFNSLLAIITGVVVWEVFRSFIQRRIPDRKQDLEALMEGDGGGGEGATRSATLLPLLRNFVLVLIVATVIIIVLSSLGVNTAPLLAGAGVVGIAVGFGAQKLVQDVVSGIFFLVDDAFRVGEYIEAGDMLGTVESISARSVRLRHHLGPVQTIPFGEIKAVKNHSRDFVIMKLKFRLPFDTDIEKVRKTIKKVGQEMLKDEELGPDFLAPVKSQGVLNVEDDALLMRMKFTAKPGKQWVIRREAYRRVKEALEQQGIRFANKQVTVHIPDA